MSKTYFMKKKFNTIFFPDFFVRIFQNRGSKPLGANFTSSSCHPRIFTFSKNLFKYKKKIWNLKENVLFSKLKNVETVKRNMEMSFSSWKDSFEEKIYLWIICLFQQVFISNNIYKNKLLIDKIQQLIFLGTLRDCVC